MTPKKEEPVSKTRLKRCGGHPMSTGIRRATLSGSVMPAMRKEMRGRGSEKRRENDVGETKKDEDPRAKARRQDDKIQSECEVLWC